MSQSTVVEVVKNEFVLHDPNAKHTLDLDSAPGVYPRGAELMNRLLDGLGFEPGDIVMTGALFGNHKFRVIPEKDEFYESKKEEIGNRIKQAYGNGLIRYGTW